MSEDSRDFGRGGCQVLMGATQGLTDESNPFYCLSFIKDSVLTSLTVKSSFDFLNKDDLLNTTIPAGTYIYGRFIEITLGSGGLIAYLEKRDE